MQIENLSLCYGICNTYNIAINQQVKVEIGDVSWIKRVLSLV